MKRLVPAAVLLAMAFAASAQTAAPVAPERVEPQPTADSAAATTADQDKPDAREDTNDRNCLRHTGSRLIRADSKGRQCAMAAGRSYSKEDIDRTGAFDLQDAIRRLDPAVH
ncbi:MAG: hypothetical protein ABWZ08_09735 [Pseudoxanthomonas sp.]